MPEAHLPALRFRTAVDTEVRRELDCLFLGVPQPPDDCDRLLTCIAPATMSNGLSMIKFNDDDCSSDMLLDQQPLLLKELRKSDRMTRESKSTPFLFRTLRR